MWTALDVEPQGAAGLSVWEVMGLWTEEQEAV